jgi:hypothetical protein
MGSRPGRRGAFFQRGESARRSSMRVKATEPKGKLERKPVLCSFHSAYVL